MACGSCSVRSPVSPRGFGGPFTYREHSFPRLRWMARREGVGLLEMSKPQGRKEMFLRASRDIETVKRHGRRISTTLFNLLTYKTDGAPSRVGIIVGKRFGNAVRRNRAKRVFRALVRQWHPDLIPGLAVLVFPKREALLKPSEEVNRMWESSLQRIHLLRRRSG